MNKVMRILSYVLGTPSAKTSPSQKANTIPTTRSVRAARVPSVSDAALRTWAKDCELYVTNPVLKQLIRPIGEYIALESVSDQPPKFSTYQDMLQAFLGGEKKNLDTLFEWCPYLKLIRPMAGTSVPVENDGSVWLTEGAASFLKSRIIQANDRMLSWGWLPDHMSGSIDLPLVRFKERFGEVRFHPTQTKMAHVAYMTDYPEPTERDMTVDDYMVQLHVRRQILVLGQLGFGFEMGLESLRDEGFFDRTMGQKVVTRVFREVFFECMGGRHRLYEEGDSLGDRYYGILTGPSSSYGVIGTILGAVEDHFTKIEKDPSLFDSHVTEVSIALPRPPTSEEQIHIQSKMRDLAIEAEFSEVARHSGDEAHIKLLLTTID